MLLAITYFLSSIINTVFGITIYIHAPYERNNQKFALLSLSIVGWVITLLLYYHSLQSHLDVLLIGRLNFFFAALIPVTMFEFVLTFPQKLVHMPKWLEMTIVGLACFLAIASFTPLVDANEMIRSGKHAVMYGPLYVYYFLILVGVSVLSIGILIRKLIKSTFTTRMQLQYLLLGIVSLTGIVVVFNGILPYFFRITALDPFGPLATVVFLYCISYAIIRHRFFDLGRIGIQVLELLLHFISLSIIYTAAAILIGLLFFPKSFALINKEYMFVAVAICVIIRIILQPFGSKVQQVADNVFGRKLYFRKKLLSEIEELTQSAVTVQTIILSILTVIARDMEISSLAYLAISGEDITEYAIYPRQRRPLRNTPLTLFLANVKEPVVTEELANGPVKTLLQSQKVAVVFPLQNMNANVSILLLGDKKNKNPYFHYDFRTLRLLSQPMTIAIQNAQYVQSIQNFNKNLKKEVTQATKELRRVNAQLRFADKRKDEFISIASHELKTPTTAIQGFLWLILQKDKALSEYSRVKLERVAKLTNQITRLVSDMLDVSKIESKNLSVYPERFDIVSLTEEIKGELDATALQKNIVIEVKNGHPYIVWADKQRARQILSNLLSNAVKYTLEKGKIKVDFKKTDSKVEVFVKDTGIGIRQEDMPRLFTKFGKLEDGNSISSHLPGTGLGLYITKHLVELSGGYIEASSKQNKGATFTFSLPTKEML